MSRSTFKFYNTVKTKQLEYNVGERLTKEKCFEQPTEGWQCLY